MEESQIATVVVNIVPTLRPFIGPIAKAVKGALAECDPLTARRAGIGRGGGRRQRDSGDLRFDVDPMFDVPSFPARTFFYTWGGGFSIQSLSLAAGGGPTLGCVNVSRQIASNLDAYGNWIFTDAIYCSYSFKADGAEYYGEQLARIDAFTFGEVQSYCYTSTTEDRSGAVDGQADTLSLQSAIVGHRWDKAAGTPRGLDVSTQVDEASRGGAALEERAEETEISTRYSITRRDYAFLPDAEAAAGDRPAGRDAAGRVAANGHAAGKRQRSDHGV